MQFTVIQDLLLALALGLLVGLQREWSKSRVAGVRTFPLITLWGAVSGLLAGRFGGWTLGAGLLALAAMLAVANLTKLRAGAKDPGLTTETAALAMYSVGAAVPAGFIGPAVVATGAVAVLLQFKKQLHGFVGRIEEADLRAVARLALIGLVVLPALPDIEYGPYGVLNPFRVWLMAVLIVGISLAAYVSYRTLGPRGGPWVAGILGGLISSTATTATYAELSRARDQNRATPPAIIVTASAIVFARVLVEIAVVAPAALSATAPPLVVMMAFMVLLAASAQRRLKSDATTAQTDCPPTSLKTAISFGLLYAIVLMGVAFAKEHFGKGGLYVVAALSGLTDMDAITLSTMQLITTGGLQPDTGWRLILVGSLANLVFKGGIVAAIGSASLLRWVGWYFGVSLVFGGLILLLWA